MISKKFKDLIGFKFLPDFLKKFIFQLLLKRYESRNDVARI